MRTMLSLDAVPLTIVIRMALTAAFVVAASIIAERAGALIGALVSTIPISAGPAYVFLAIDHEPAFLADSTIASLAINAGNAIFCLVYVLLAQRQPTQVSLPAVLILWFALAFAIRAVEWTFVAALVVNIVVFGICIAAVRPFLHVAMPPAIRRWYDIPLRAGLTACLVATVVEISSHVGPIVTGVLAIFPIALATLMLVLQPRVGGPATAAVIAHAITGLVGFGGAATLLHLTVIPLGSPVALTAALAVTVCWNVAVYLVRRPKRAG
jgi:hypothetical protein